MEILWRSERRRAKAVGAYEAVTVTQKGSNMKHKPSVWHYRVSQLYKEHEALYAFGICCLNIFFFFAQFILQIPAALNTRSQQLPQGAESGTFVWKLS